MQIGNALATRTSLLMYFSCAWGCRPLLEQPRNSRAEIHPRLQQAFYDLNVYQASIWGGKYSDAPSQSSPKRHSLYSTDGELLKRLEAFAGGMTGEELQAFGEDGLVKRQRKEDGSYAWTGNDRMKQSQRPDCMLSCGPLLWFRALRGSIWKL